MVELKGKAAARPTRKEHLERVPLPRAARKSQPKAAHGVKRQKSVSFQIRTAPETKTLAECVADTYETGGRSKLDAEMYKRGLLLTMVLLGPNEDGLYAGMSEQELARQLTPLFDRQYAVLDRHHMLAEYVYRVLPPGGMGYLASPSAPVATSADANGHRPQSAGNEQAHYTLGEEAQGTLENFAEEI